MNKFKMIISILILSTLFCAKLAFADNSSPIKFFVSNNDHIISLKTAYHRLIGKPEKSLEGIINQYLYAHHIQITGIPEKILGTYIMLKSNKYTADNTEAFWIAPNQFSNESDIFKIATDFDRIFNQDSVAILIPDNNKQLVDIKIIFNRNNRLTIKQTINVINKVLPAQYNQGFSLGLVTSNNDFNTAKIQSIEWLSSHLNLQDIKNLPISIKQIITNNGSAYVVYKNGSVRNL